MILDEIAEKTRERIDERKQALSLEEIKKQALDIVARETENGNKPYSKFPFEEALKAHGISFICEVKKASPSKGLIAPDFPYVDIAKEYEEAGAAAISVLTEPYYFQGSNDYLREITENVSIPVLRKDFTIDEYMVYEAKAIGASAVLLICAILSDEEIAAWIRLSEALGMSTLVEAHDAEEIKRAVACGAKIIGVNNRDLKTFTVDIMNSVRLRKLVPDNTVYVSESGIKTPEDIARLKNNGTNAVLIGETFMRHPDKRATLKWLLNGYQ